MSDNEVRPARDAFTARLASACAVNGFYTLFGDVDSFVCEELIQFLGGFRADGTTSPTIYICSDGGDADPARAVASYIEMQQSEGVRVTTIGLGTCCSAALDIFLVGSKGRRFAHEDTLFMAHASAASSATRKETRLRNALDDAILERYTRIKKPQRERMLETGDWYFSAAEAVALGVADKVIERGQPLPD